MQDQRPEVKMYSDYKSPYAYLAFDPGLALEQRYNVRVRWRPFQLRLKGNGQRSVYSEYKVKYSYLDARRWANLRPAASSSRARSRSTTPRRRWSAACLRRRRAGWSTTAAPCSTSSSAASWRWTSPMRLPASSPLGMSEQAYRDYLAGEGMRAYEAAQEEAVADSIFGVPIFVFKGEPFWGHDRIPLLEHRLAEAGLARNVSTRTPRRRRGLDDSQSADAHGLPRARHHPVRGRADLHAHPGRARRRRDQDRAGAARRPLAHPGHQAARDQSLLTKHLFLPAQPLQALPGAGLEAPARDRHHQGAGGQGRRAGGELRPGVMARAGLDYAELSAINPRLVMCSISVAGQSGPLSGQPGYDYIAAAYAGITDQIGEAGGSPAQFTIAIGDVSTGVAAAMAVGFALLHRERTGEGQQIDGAILDTYFHMHEVNVPRVALRGDKFTPKRTGSQHPDGGPTGLFRCSDGSYINITALAAPVGPARRRAGQAGAGRRSPLQGRPRAARQ